MSVIALPTLIMPNFACVKYPKVLLDEFPNIGERRKSALLKNSVQSSVFVQLQWSRLPRCQVSAVKAAGELKAFLEARSNTPIVPQEH